MYEWLPQPPKGHEHFAALAQLLEAQSPFSFVRFSDGETEIIRNERLIIGHQKLEWRKGTFEHHYPTYDQKTFEPDLHGQIRNDLINSASLKQEFFFKGIPASHNLAVADRDMMIDLNGGKLDNLTFADLFLNGNYKRFISQILPLLTSFFNVYVVGNYRMQPAMIGDTWRLIPVPDNFFQSYEVTLSSVLNSVEHVPTNSLILSSASSLSNILGASLRVTRSDITFIDIGTSLHSLMGMDSRTRRYHVAIEPWTRQNSLKKLKNMASRDYRLRW